MAFFADPEYRSAGMRQKQLAVAGLLVLAAFAGCSMLSGPVTFSANKATVSHQALSQTNYQKESVKTQVINRTFKAAGQSKKVKVTNWVARYDRKVNLGPLGSKRAAVFSAVATPQVKVLGQGPFNPVAHYSNKQLVLLLQKNYKSIHDVQHVKNTSATMLGKQTTVSKYKAKATLKGGNTVNVYVDVTKVEDGGDYVIALAVYPQQLDNQESSHVKTLMAGVQHNASS